MRNLGILWVLYGLLRLVGALGVFLYSGRSRPDVGRAAHPRAQSVTMMGLFHSFLIFVIILGIVAGVVSIIAGLGLMSSGASARSLGLVAAFFGLTNGPLGIALGAYTLVVARPGRHAKLLDHRLTNATAGTHLRPRLAAAAYLARLAPLLRFVLRSPLEH